jgi:hypothetical protein
MLPNGEIVVAIARHVLEDEKARLVVVEKFVVSRI